MTMLPTRALLIAALVLALPAQARETLVIGVENQYYLPLQTYEKGEYRGFARDLLDAFARDKGYAIEYRALPVPRLYASFFEGQVDLKFPDNPRWKAEERQGKTIRYSDPVAAYIDGTSVLPARRHAGPDAIRRLGTVDGFTPWAWMDSIQSGRVSLSENAHLESLVRQTLAGRVDAAYANVAVINFQLDQVLGQPGALVFDPGLPYSRDHYYLSSIRRPEVLASFNTWLRDNRERVAALKKKHGVEKGVEKVADIPAAPRP